MSPSRVTVLELSKIVTFLQFFGDISKECNTVYPLHAFESSRLALLENGIGYYAVTSSLEDIISL